MLNHTKVYLVSRGISPCDRDSITCEIPGCGQQATGVHHINPRGMGGSKTKDYPENLIGLCMNDHSKAEAKKYTKEFLTEIAARSIKHVI